MSSQCSSVNHRAQLRRICAQLLGRVFKDDCDDRAPVCASYELDGHQWIISRHLTTRINCGLGTDEVEQSEYLLPSLGLALQS